jgi:hypothetical protein
MHILPMDTVVSVMPNAYWTASAGPLRRMHRAMAEARDLRLPSIPLETYLATTRTSTLEDLALDLDRKGT